MTDLPAVTDRDVYITRSFAAPRATVWKFWTEPERLAEWFGPTGVHTPVERIDVELREGGTWHLGMTDNVSGEIEDVILRIQFHDHGETTRMTLRQRPFTPENRNLTIEGWEQSFLTLDTIFEGATA